MYILVTHWQRVPPFERRFSVERKTASLGTVLKIYNKATLFFSLFSIVQLTKFFTGLETNGSQLATD